MTEFWAESLLKSSERNWVCETANTTTSNSSAGGEATISTPYSWATSSGEAIGSQMVILEVYGLKALTNADLDNLTWAGRTWGGILSPNDEF